MLNTVPIWDAVANHVDEDDRQNYQNGTFESPRGMTIINESGLYSLVLSNKLPSIIFGMSFNL